MSAPKPLFVSASIGDSTIPEDHASDPFYLRQKPGPGGLALWADPARPTSWDYPGKYTPAQRREVQALAGVMCRIAGQDPCAVLDQERFDDGARPGCFATSWAFGVLIQRQDVYLGRAAAALAEAERRDKGAK